MSDDESWYIGEGEQTIRDTSDSNGDFSFVSGGGGSYIRPRRYKCPKCGGEFDIWSKRNISKEACPFCGTEKRRYDSESDNE